MKIIFPILSAGVSFFSRPIDAPTLNKHKILQGLLLSVGLAFPCHAKQAPADMKKFNLLCPANEICPKLRKVYGDCVQNKKTACDLFIDTFRKLLPEYDCQRSSDAGSTINYIVPAIWLCGEENVEKYIDFAAKSSLPKAKKLFASPEFRNSLDGKLAEQYFDRSLDAEKRFKHPTKKAGIRH